jgi:oxygen-independent coproporphyrinogen-3 oxidase
VKSRFARLAGRPLDEVVDRTAVARLTASGHLTDTPERLVATPAGYLALNAVLRELLA